MARVWLGSLGLGTIWEDVSDVVHTGNAVTAQVNTIAGAAATHWSARTGGTSSTAAITANAKGRLDRWIDPGMYRLAVAGDDLYFDAVTGEVANNLVGANIAVAGVYPARPPGFLIVIWVGTTDPGGAALANDLWPQGA